MYLKVSRDLKLEDRTGGVLYVDEDFFGYTCEDTVRDSKITGKTAIPAGTYDVVLEDSPKYGKDCPTIKDVPGFTYIRIHSGNTEEDTEGCLLVGYKQYANGTIAESRPAIAKLKAMIQAEIKSGGEVQLSIG